MSYAAITIGRGLTLRPEGPLPRSRLRLEARAFFRADLGAHGSAWRGGPVRFAIYCERPCAAPVSAWDRIGVAEGMLAPYPRSDNPRAGVPPWDRQGAAQVAAAGNWLTGGWAGVKGAVALDAPLWPGAYRLALALFPPGQGAPPGRLEWTPRQAAEPARLRDAEGQACPALQTFHGAHVEGAEALVGQAVLVLPVPAGLTMKGARDGDIPDPVPPSHRRHGQRIGQTSLGRAAISGAPMTDAGAGICWWRYAAKGGADGRAELPLRFDFAGQPVLMHDPWAVMHGPRQDLGAAALKVPAHLRNILRNLLTAADATPVERSPFAPAYCAGLIAARGKAYDAFLRDVETSISLAAFAIDGGRKTEAGDAPPEAKVIGLRQAARAGVVQAAARDPNNLWARAAAARFLMEAAWLRLTVLDRPAGEDILLATDLALTLVCQLRCWDRCLDRDKTDPYRIAADFAGRSYVNFTMLGDLNTALHHAGLYEELYADYPRLRALAETS